MLTSSIIQLNSATAWAYDHVCILWDWRDHSWCLGLPQTIHHGHWVLLEQLRIHVFQIFLYWAAHQVISSWINNLQSKSSRNDAHLPTDYRVFFGFRFALAYSANQSVEFSTPGRQFLWHIRDVADHQLDSISGFTKACLRAMISCLNLSDIQSVVRYTAISAHVTAEALSKNEWFRKVPIGVQAFPMFSKPISNSPERRIERGSLGHWGCILYLHALLGLVSLLNCKAPPGSPCE